MVLYLVHVSLNGLKNSVRDMMILMMIQGVSHHQLLIISKAVETHKLVARHNWIKKKLMGDQLHIDWEIICYNVYKDYGKRKICANFVPCTVIDEKRSTVKICEYFILTCQINQHFLNCIVTGDKSSLFQYDAETIHQYMKKSSGEQYHYHHSPRSFTCQSQGSECLSHFL